MNSPRTKTTDQVEPVLIAAKAVEKLTGCSRFTIYRLQREAGFPKAIKTGSNIQAPRLFVEGEVRQWIADRIAERA